MLKIIRFQLKPFPWSALEKAPVGSSIFDSNIVKWNPFVVKNILQSTNCKGVAPTTQKLSIHADGSFSRLRERHSRLSRFEECDICIGQYEKLGPCTLFAPGKPFVRTKCERLENDVSMRCPL